MPTPTAPSGNPELTKAVSQYVENADARPAIDTFSRLDTSSFQHISDQMFAAENTLNLLRGNAIGITALRTLHLPPGGRNERYWVSPATATLKLNNGGTETVIPADNTERTVGGIVIRRFSVAENGRSVIEIRAAAGQTGRRSFAITDGETTSTVEFELRERNESRAESHFELRQQLMTAALERLTLEQGILSATTDRAQRVRTESNLARLRELNLKLTADQAREIDIYQFLRQAQEFAREYNEYVRVRPGEMPEAARQRTAFATENRATLEALNEQLRIMTVAGEVHSWVHARYRNVSLREDAQIVMPDDAMRKKMGEVLSWLDQKNDPAFPPSKQEVEQPWNTLLLKIQQFRTTQNDTNRAEVDAAMEGFRMVLLQAVHRITQQRGWLDAGSVGPAFGDIFGIARDPSVRIRTTDVSINAADNVPLLAAIGPTIDLPRAGRQRITVPAGDLYIGGTADANKLANGTSRTVGSLTFQRSTDGLTLIVIAAALSADISQDVAIKTSADAAVRTVPVSYRRTGQVQESTMVNALRTGLFIQRHRTVSADLRERVSSPATAVPDAIGLTPGYPRHAITNVPAGPLTVNDVEVAPDARQVVIGGIKVSRNREGGTILWIEPASLDPTGPGLARHEVRISGGGARITTHINFNPLAGDRGANPIRDGIQEARTIRRQYFAYDQEVMTHRLQTNEILTLQGNLHGLPMPEGWNGGIGLLNESRDVPYRTALEAWMREDSVTNATALRGHMNRLLQAAGLPQTVTAENLQSYLETSKAGSIDVLMRSRNPAYIAAIGNWLRAGDATTAGALVTATNSMLASQRPPEAQVAAAGNMERLMRTAGCGHIGLVLRSSVDRQFTMALVDWKESPSNAGRRDLLVAQANRVLQEIRPPFTPAVINVTNLARVMDLAGLKPTPTIPDAETVLIGNLRRKLGETTAETLPLRNAYNRWLIRHTAEATTALVTQANTALSRLGDPYVTAANLTQKLEMAGQETREAVMRGPIGVIMAATYHQQFNEALTAYNTGATHLTTQRMFEKINLVLRDAGLPELATASQVRYLLQISGRLTAPARAGNPETVSTFQREIELARNQSFNTLSRYYETWNGRLDRGATVQELSEHLLTMGGVMRNDPFAELSQAVDGDRNRNWMRQVWDYSPVGLLHSGVNVASGRPEWSSMTHVRNGSFYGMRESFVPIPRISNGRLRWSGDLTTPTSESAYILQAQGINIDGFDEASVDSRADMLREQLPDEIRKTLVQIREQYQPRLSGPQGAITLASANHGLLDAYANARPVSRLTGAPIRPPENRPSDYEKVGLLVRLRRTLSTMPAEERVYLEGQANSRIANAANPTLAILPNMDGTPAQPLTGLPAWLTGDTWPAAEGDFEGLDGPKAVYAYVVLMNRFRTSATTVPQIQASIDALPALSDLRTNDDAAGQSMGMYRYLLDRQSILQDGMRIVSQDYSTACARAVELHIMQAQTNHALQGSNNLDALLLAAGLAQFWVYGAARNMYRHGFFGGLYRSTIGTRGYIFQPFTWTPRDIVAGGYNAARRIFYGPTPPAGPSNVGRALTASEGVNLQRNVSRVREIAQELGRIRGTHADAVSRITKNLQSQIAGLNPVTDAARIQQLEAAAAREIQLAQQANAQVVRQLQAERTLLGRNVATSLDGVSDLTRTQWARTLMGGDDAIRALGRSAAEIQALERGILAAHNIGAGQRLTDLAVDASRNPIMHAGRQLNVRDAKWLRLRQAFEEAGIPWNAASRNMARHLMDGACGQGASGTARTLSTTAEVAQALRGQSALIQSAVRAGRMTAQEAQVLIALMRAGRLTESQAKILAAAARAGEIDHAAVAALRSATNWARAGRFISGLGRVASFAGAAFDSYVLISETQALLEGRQRIQKAMQVLAKQLTDARFEPVGAVDAQTGIAMRYRHAGSGFTIDINNMESQLQWINATEHGGRMLGAGIGLGLFVTSFAVGGPVGLAIAIGGAIITIVITTAAEAWSDLQRARFLHDAPPFLFAVWNSTQALGKPTHEMMKSLKEVSWWRHIVLGQIESIRDASVQAMYPAIEKKLAFQLFKEELTQYAPEVFAMVMEDAGGPVAFDTFFTSNTGFNRIYDFWGTELGALTGKNMNDRGQRADAVGDSLATRRAMRYAVARHMIARNAEQHPAAVKRAADAEAVARSREPVTFAQVEPFVRFFPDEDIRAEILRNTANPVYLRQVMESLVNHLEIQADMLQAHNVNVNDMDGSWRTDPAERMRLYRAAFKDPLICHQLQREYQDVVPDGDANQAGGGLLNAVRTTQLVAAGLPQDNWELARMHLLNLGGRRRDIDALLSPQVTESVARQQLTAHISGYVGTRPNGRYARVDSTPYFPRTADARERPSVYLSYPDTFMNGAQAQVTAKCRSMCAIADEFPGLTNSANLKMKAVAFNVVPIRAHRVQRTSRGFLEHPAREEYPETHYLINATYYLENQADDSRQTIIATKGAYLYQNGANTLDVPRNTTQWYTHTGAMQLQSYQAFMGTREQNRSGNRELDTLVNGDLAARLTDDAIQRSEERYGPREPLESRPERFRREPLVDAVFNNTRNRPIAFVSTSYGTPHNYSFDPTSPEYALCQALASPPNRMTEDNPQAVFFEFERRGNEITALATYVDGTTRVRRRSARAVIRSRLALRGGERAQTIEGVVHTGAIVHGIDMNRVSALRHFILNGGDTEGEDQLAPRGNRTTNLWEAQMPPMGVPQLNLIQRSVKRRNRERVEEALKAVGEDSGSLVPGKFVPAGMDESGRAQYIMHLPRADNGRDAYVLKSVRNPQDSQGAPVNVTIRNGNATQTIQVRYPNQEQFDTYTYHSQGDQWDETISLSNLNELLRRPNLTFHDRERAMRVITAGHDRTSDAEPVQSELLRFLSNFPTEMRPGTGMPPAQDQASFVLAVRVSAAYEAAADKNAFLWELSDRITQLSSGIVMFAKIPDITRDLGNRPVPRSLSEPNIGDAGMAFNSGINEYGVRYFQGDNAYLATINESSVGSRPYTSGRVDRLNREGVSSKVYVRRYGSAQTVVRSNGFIHEWSTLNYLRDRTGNDPQNAQRREIFENIITAPSTIRNPGTDRTQLYHFMRPVNRILDGWMYEEQCFDVRDQVSNASDGRQRFAGIIGRMYLEVPDDRRQDFLRALFTVMETIDGSDGQHDGILSANWRTPTITDITRELDGAVLCTTFQSVIMELRRRFPVSEERLARESLRSMGTLPTPLEVAMAPASRQAQMTRAILPIGDLRYHIFVRGARQADTATLRQAAVRIVPQLSDEQSLLSMRNWSEASPTLQTGVTATDGIAPGSTPFLPRELRYSLNYSRRVNITNAAPTIPVNELPAEPFYFNGTLVPADATDLTIGPVKVTRTNAGRSLSVVRVNTGADLNNFDIRIIGGSVSVATLRYSMPDIRYLKPGYVPTAGRGINESSRAYWADLLTIPVEKRVGRLLNGEPLRQLLDICSREFNRDQGIDRKYDLYRGLSDMYWRCNDQERFLQVLVDVLSGQQAIPGASGNITVDGVIREANIPHIVAYMGAAARNAGPRAYRIETVAPEFVEPPETAARGTPEYVNFQMRGLRDRVLATQTVTREQLQESIDEINQSIGGVEFANMEALRTTVGNPIALNDNTAAIMLNDAGTLGIYELDALRKGAVAQWQGIIDASGAENQASLNRRIERLQYIMQGVHCLNETVPEIETAEPKEWRLPNHLFTLRMNGEDAFSLEPVTPPTVDGLFGGVREAAEGGRWQEVDEACTTGAIGQNIRFLTPENQTALLERINKALPLTTTVRFVLGPRSIAVENLSQIEREDRAAPERVTPAAREARRKTLFDAAAASPTAPRYAETLTAAIAAIGADYVRTPTDERAAFVTALNTRFVSDGLPVRVRANGEALERAPDVNLVEPVATRFNALVAAARVGSPSLPLTTQGANITAAIALLAPHVASLESADRPAFVSSLNRQLRAAGTAVQLRLNGEVLERGPDATGVTVTAPALVLPNVPEAAEYRESRVLLRMFIQKRNAENTAWLPDFIRIDNPSGTVAAGNELLASWGIVKENVDAGLALESYFDGQNYRFRNDTAGRHAYTYRFRFNQAGRFRMTGQLMVNGRAGDAIPEVLQNVTANTSDVSGVRNILAQAQVASPDRWNEVAGGTAGTRYHYDVTNRRLHSFDGTSYRTLNANYTWTAASTTRPSGLPAPG